MKLCVNCQRELQDRMHICPYCGEEQYPVTPVSRRSYAQTNEADVSSDKAKAVAVSAVAGLTGYFGYMREKWAGRSERVTEPMLSMLTMLLMSVFFGLGMNIMNRGNFVGFLRNTLVVLLFLILAGLVGFLLYRTLLKREQHILHFMYEYANYLILPMIVSLLGMLIALFKFVNVAWVMFFAVLFMVLAAVLAKLTRLDSDMQRSHFATLLILCVLLSGLILVVIRYMLTGLIA